MRRVEGGRIIQYYETPSGNRNEIVQSIDTGARSTPVIRIMSQVPSTPARADTPIISRGGATPSAGIVEHQHVSYVSQPTTHYTYNSNGSYATPIRQTQAQSSVSQPQQPRSIEALREEVQSLHALKYSLQNDIELLRRTNELLIQKLYLKSISSAMR